MKLKKVTQGQVVCNLRTEIDIKEQILILKFPCSI